MMRRKTVVLLVAATGSVAGLLPRNASGSVIASDPFLSYNTGSLSPQGQGTGWASNWTNVGQDGAHTTYVGTLNSTTYLDGQVGSANSAISVSGVATSPANASVLTLNASSGTNSQDFRQFETFGNGIGDPSGSNASVSNLYIGYIIDPLSTNTRGGGVEVDSGGIGGTGTVNGTGGSSDTNGSNGPSGQAIAFGQTSSGSTYGFAIDPPATNSSTVTKSSTVSATENTPVYLVLGIENINAGTSGTITATIKLWVNPTTSSYGSPNVTDTGASMFQLNTDGLDTMRFYAGSTSGNSFDFDDLTIGTTFADVTMPEPGSAAMIAIACGGLLARRRRFRLPLSARL